MAQGHGALGVERCIGAVEGPGARHIGEDQGGQVEDDLFGAVAGDAGERAREAWCGADVQFAGDGDGDSGAVPARLGAKPGGTIS